MKLLSPSTWPIFQRSVNPQSESPAIALKPEEIIGRVKSWSENPPERNEVVRVMSEFNREMRSYAAGQVDEYNADFKGTYGSANSEILPGQYGIRARTRTLVKDTPQGKVVKRTFQNNVIGNNPFKLDMRYGSFEQQTGANGKTTKKFIENEEVNEGVEKFWKWYCKQENFTISKLRSFMEEARVVEGALVTDGRIICRMHRDYPFNEIGFAVDFLEADRLQDQYQGKSGSDGRFGAGNPIVGSVEYHFKWKFPVAYWLLTRHPGEFIGQQFAGETKAVREQVPAADIIDINNLRDRAEQFSGMTEFDAAVQTIWRHHQFKKAHALCATASAIRAFVLEKKFPTGMEMPHEMKEALQNAMLNFGSGGAFGEGDGKNSVTAQQGGGTPYDSLRPGQERELPYGVESKMHAPPFPIEGAHEFGLDNGTEVALATGISQQHATGNYQNLGFIAGLMCQTPFQDWCKIRQTHLVECWLSRLFREALKAAIMSGWFDRRGYDLSISKLEDYCDAAHFKGKRWAFVNPLVQMQTLILALEAKIMSPQQVQEELPDGVSIEDLYRLWADAKHEAETHGLDLDPSAAAELAAQEPDDAGIPAKPGSEDGDAGKTPAKTKKQSPRSSGVIGLNRISGDTMALIAQSANGAH